jgi:hypothetical protein
MSPKYSPKFSTSMFENLQKKAAEVIKEETSAKSIKKRLSWSTVSDAANAIRAVSGTISLLCLSVSQIPVDLPKGLDDWTKWASVFFGVIAGGAHLNKGKK